MSDHYETRCPSCGGSDEQGCYADCPTHHIAALEARVRELEDVLKLADETLAHQKYTPDHWIRMKIAAALNQEKQK